MNIFSRYRGGTLTLDGGTVDAIKFAGASSETGVFDGIFEGVPYILRIQWRQGRGGEHQVLPFSAVNTRLFVDLGVPEVGKSFDIEQGMPGWAAER